MSFVVARLLRPLITIALAFTLSGCDLDMQAGIPFTGKHLHVTYRGVHSSVREAHRQ
jgi:hypothetical protein